MTTPYNVSDPLSDMETFLAEQQKQGILVPSLDLEVITPRVEFVGPPPDGEAIMRHLEVAIRTAYKSEDKIGPDSHKKILSHILSLKHESTLEHTTLSFRATTSRGVTHELVRHRIASYTQESTRYVNYSKRSPQVVLPWHLLDRSTEEQQFWFNGQREIIGKYQEALKMGWKPQDARGFLPNDLKTEIVFSMNLRSLRNFVSLRCAASAHPDMQVIARETLKLLQSCVPLIFQDISR